LTNINVDLMMNYGMQWKSIPYTGFLIKQCSTNAVNYILTLQ